VQPITRSLISLITSGCLFIANCETSSIGVVKSSGDFHVNSSALRGNGTVFDGSLLETAAARSEVQLSNGTRVTLTPESRAKLFRDRTVLEKGSSEVKSAGNYKVSALGMTMTPESKGTVMQIAMNQPRRVSVSALGGAVEVRSAAGMLVARVMPDTALEFDPQAGASTASNLTGCLEAVSGKYFLTDETTNVKVEVQGNGVEKAAGSRVKMTGATIPGETPAGGAAQLVSATDITKVGSCKKKVAAGAAAGGGAAGATAGGGAAAGGLSAGAIAAIVGGVSVAGAVVGAKAAGVWGGSSAPSASPR